MFILKLRRTKALGKLTKNNYLCKSDLDLTSSSNKDIILTSNALKYGKFKHPRARQMAAAARYGYKFYPHEAQYPEVWLDKLSM